MLRHRTVTNIIEELTGIFTETKTLPRGLNGGKYDYESRRLFAEMIKAHQSQSLISVAVPERVSNSETIKNRLILTLHDLAKRIQQRL